MIIPNVPFYSNPDNTHCDQAVIRMVLKHFLPKKDFDWQKLEKITGKKKGLWTWPMVGLLNLKKMGFDVSHLTLFDYERFSKLGLDYLRERVKDEKVIQAQNKHSDIEYERKNALEYSQAKIQKKILPALADIKKFLDDGNLVVCNVNLNALNNKEGYTGHFVLIFGYDNKNLYLHDPGILNDPGLPPIKNRKVSYSVFKNAWEYPSKKQRNIRAFKLN